MISAVTHLKGCGALYKHFVRNMLEVDCMCFPPLSQTCFLVGLGQYDRVGPALCLELVLAIAAGPGEAAVFEG